MTPAYISASLSRREIMRSAAWLGAGVAMAGMPAAARALSLAANDWPAVEGMMQRYVRQQKVANMVAAMGWQQDATEYLTRGTLAFNSTVRADQDSLYRIYSMTKPITGMAAMMLVDEGRLGLDQELAEIIPSFANMQVQKVYDGAITAGNLEPAVRPITIRQLLTHTSGLGYGIIQQGPIAEAFMQRGLIPGLVSRLEMPGVFRGTPAASLELFADRLATMPLVYQPGTRWSYSVGLDLMGRVIEVVSGQKFDDFLQQRILNPCGMASTGFQVPHSDIGRLTTNYFILGGLLLPIDSPASSVYTDSPPFPFGGAGLVSTARDYDRFLQMLAGYGALEGRRVMSEAAVRMGTSNLLPTTMNPADPFMANYDFGAGGRLGRGDEAGVFGWFGAAGTCGLVNMKTGLRHNLMTQYMPAPAYRVEQEFPAAVLVDAGHA